MAAETRGGSLTRKSRTRISVRFHDTIPSKESAKTMAQEVTRIWQTDGENTEELKAGSRTTHKDNLRLCGSEGYHLEILRSGNQCLRTLQKELAVLEANHELYVSDFDAGRQISALEDDISARFEVL